MSSAWVTLQSLDTPALKGNIAFLQSCQHELLNLFVKPVLMERLLFQKQGDWIRCCAHSEPPVWLIGEIDAGGEVARLRDRIVSAMPERGLLILIGGAIGYGAAVAIPFLLQNPGLHVLIIEPTPDRVMAAFALVDMQNALATERLHFVVGELEAGLLLERMDPFNLWDIETVSVFCSPELDGKIDPEAFAQRWREYGQSVREKTERLLGDLAQPVSPSGTVERVMIVNCWAGAPGGLHIQSIEASLRKRGIQTRVLTLNRYRFDRAAEEYRRMVERQMLSCFRTYRPNWVLSFGYHAPQFVSPPIFEALDIRWIQMVSNIAYYDELQYPGEFTFVAEERMIPIFQKRGYGDVRFIPLMANYVPSAPIKSDGRFPLIILGNSLASPPDQVAPFLESWRGRDELLRYIHEAERTLSIFDDCVNFYRYLEENPIPQIENPREWYRVFRYLLCQASSERRIQILETLAPLGLNIFGSGWERTVSPDSPIRGCLRGFLPLSEEPQVFAHGRIFINTHTIGNDTGPNMRFFNVAGMGAFQISDCPWFEHFLSHGEEIVYCSSLREYAENVRYYLDHPQEMEAIRHNAQKRIRENWTYDHWLDRIFETVLAEK